MIMDSCTQLTSLKPGHPVGFVWQAQMESRPQLRGRSFGWILELYRVATFAMLVAAGGMRREGKSLCRAKWVISMFALHRGRSHKGIKAERRSLLAVAHRSMSLQLELMHHLRRVRLLGTTRSEHLTYDNRTSRAPTSKQHKTLKQNQHDLLLPSHFRCAHTWVAKMQKFGWTIRHLVIVGQTPMSLTQPKHLAPAFAEPSCGQRLLQICLEWVDVASCSITKYINVKFVDILNSKQTSAQICILYTVHVLKQYIYINLWI